jgi:hypothetical protein
MEDILRATCGEPGYKMSARPTGMERKCKTTEATKVDLHNRQPQTGTQQQFNQPDRYSGINERSQI